MREISQSSGRWFPVGRMADGVFCVEKLGRNVSSFSLKPTQLVAQPFEGLNISNIVVFVRAPQQSP